MASAQFYILLVQIFLLKGVSSFHQHICTSLEPSNAYVPVVQLFSGISPHVDWKTSTKAAEYPASFCIIRVTVNLIYP